MSIEGGDAGVSSSFDPRERVRVLDPITNTTAETPTTADNTASGIRKEERERREKALGGTDQLKRKRWSMLHVCEGGGRMRGGREVNEMRSERIGIDRESPVTMAE